MIAVKVSECFGDFDLRLLALAVERERDIVLWGGAGRYVEIDTRSDFCGDLGALHRWHGKDADYNHVWFCGDDVLWFLDVHAKWARTGRLGELQV